MSRRLIHPDFRSYLRDLANHNERDWFNQHRARYEEVWMGSARDLVEALMPVAEALDPPHRGAPKVNKSIRKLHRDTRFSKDKRPFDPRLHLIFWTGDHPLRSPGIHLVFEAESFGFGAGFWAFGKPEIERYREAVQSVTALAELNSALADAKKVGCELEEPELKRVPRPFDQDHPAGEWLRRKGLVARTLDSPPYGDRLSGAKALEPIAAVMHALAPLNRWIQQHVMP